MSTASADQRLAIEIEQEFSAPRDRVFERWTDAAALARWFAAPGYTTVDAVADPRPGGAWRLAFRSADGHEYSEEGVFREVDPPGHLVFTLTQVDGDHPNPETVVTVDFEETGSQGAPSTRMRFSQRGFRAVTLRDQNAQGWRGCFAALGRDLFARADETDGAERELRAVFEAWFDASERKDLDASMAPIADDVVSYEHEAPQEYRGARAVREVCAAGFEYQGGDFRWHIPDLQIRIAGDLAVTWGLNRMRGVAPDGTTRDQWSRGTRVFERRDGRWQMIHQHVSFPVDAEGRASMSR